MSLWWLQPGWTQARCSYGAQIYPEGDPDWGSCLTCFSAGQDQQGAEEAYYREQEAAYLQAAYEAEDLISPETAPPSHHTPQAN